MVRLNFSFVSLFAGFMMLQINLQLTQIMNLFDMWEFLGKSFVLFNKIPPALVITIVDFYIILLKPKLLNRILTHSHFIRTLDFVYSGWLRVLCYWVNGIDKFAEAWLFDERYQSIILRVRHSSTVFRRNLRALRQGIMLPTFVESLRRLTLLALKISILLWKST